MRLLGFALLLTLFACSSPDDTARVNANVGDRSTFPPVAQALVHRCGSIDCHGSTYRNFRVYGYGGLRLAPGDMPDIPDAGTPAEANATYDTFVSLEPEKTAAVLQAHGAGLDNLTVIRKGRNDEDHKGGRLIVRGDDADICLTAWLSGTPNAEACARVLTEP
jgi:hypothetical protein